MNALLICDDADEMAILSLVLERVGLAVTPAMNPRRAIGGWAQASDLILAALHNDHHPVELTRQMRDVTDAPLVIIARAYDEDLFLDALAAGADWITTRPYSARLLIGQLQALMRRGKGIAELSLPSLQVGGLSLNPSTRTVRPDGLPPRRLTHLEFRLLYTLMMHRGQTLPTAALVERVWGYEGEGSPELVRGLISRLRAKIEHNPKSPRLVLTVPGVGYCLSNSEE
ncbi:MAG TPA: response regulator transcription factor [Chloroflexi bacterium]|nr:response regulator transcription factor [Chloroflexota bacterium]